MNLLSQENIEKPNLQLKVLYALEKSDIEPEFKYYLMNRYIACTIESSILNKLEGSINTVFFKYKGVT